MRVGRSLMTILKGFSGQRGEIEQEGSLNKFLVGNRRALSGKRVEMTVLANQPRVEQLYQVVSDENGVIFPVGRCSESQVVYPIFEHSQIDQAEIGYMLLDGAGLYCYDAFGGEAVLFASAQGVMLANFNPIKARIAFQSGNFSRVNVEGLLGCVWEGRALPFAEIPSGQEIVADSLSFTLVATIDEKTEKIGVCPTTWVDPEQLAEATGKFLQPVWNQEAFEEGYFDVDGARLVGLLAR